MTTIRVSNEGKLYLPVNMSFMRSENVRYANGLGLYIYRPYLIVRSY